MYELISNSAGQYWHLVVFGAVIIAVLIAHAILMKVLARVMKQMPSVNELSIVRRLRAPIRWIILVVAISALVPIMDVPDTLRNPVSTILATLFIISLAWLVMRIVLVFADHLRARHSLDVADNLQARKIHTQVQFLTRFINIVIALVAVAVILMRFERVQEFGTSILASAGIAGIIIGLAAQRTLGTLFAGLQIAWTQPIRIDDVVIVESEWGRIEEITLTYVVVRVWDQRRLILPITHFVEKPFQNWTRVSADLLGTVFLYVDYRVDVDALREELTRIVSASPLWDGKVCVLQVTNATERTMEIRALVSASDSSNAWTLRCEVREKLVRFIQQRYPDALPTFRAELVSRDQAQNPPDLLPGSP
ncbi:MAG: mechanosensitive ion channel [Desulfomonilia bacterium]|nr:mechanosensitive ion channel [Desulfomonilia bacterium]